MYEIVISSHFKKQLKPYLKKDKKLLEKLKTNLNNFEKTQAISLGQDMYKTRIQGMEKGKSGGYRLYIHIMEIDEILSPICIYPKSSQENITKQELRWHLQTVTVELRKMM